MCVCKTFAGLLSRVSDPPSSVDDDGPGGMTMMRHIRTFPRHVAACRIPARQAPQVPFITVDLCFMFYPPPHLLPIGCSTLSLHFSVCDVCAHVKYIYKISFRSASAAPTGLARLSSPHAHHATPYTQPYVCVASRRAPCRTLRHFARRARAAARRASRVCEAAARCAQQACRHGEGGPYGRQTGRWIYRVFGAAERAGGHGRLRRRPGHRVRERRGYCV